MRKYYPIVIVTCSIFILYLVFSIYLQGKLIKTDLLSIIAWFILLCYTIYLYFQKSELPEETEGNKFILPHTDTGNQHHSTNRESTYFYRNYNSRCLSYTNIGEAKYES